MPCIADFTAIPCTNESEFSAAVIRRVGSASFPVVRLRASGANFDFGFAARCARSLGYHALVADCSRFMNEDLALVVNTLDLDGRRAVLVLIHFDQAQGGFEADVVPVLEAMLPIDLEPLCQLVVID